MAITRDVAADSAMTEINWDGVRRPETLSAEEVSLRSNLADLARKYEWQGVLRLLTEHPRLINVTRLGGKSMYAPLHQAAHGGASVAVVRELVKLGAWRLLRDQKGDCALDIARRKGHVHLDECLMPIVLHNLRPLVLQQWQKHFHELIRERAREQVQEHALRLPELEVMLEYRPVKCWFPVPGMYGGFLFWLEADGTEAKLVSESWCRVVDGSGQRHEITVAGWRLVDEGFV